MVAKKSVGRVGRGGKSGGKSGSVGTGLARTGTNRGIGRAGASVASDIARQVNMGHPGAGHPNAGALMRAAAAAEKTEAGTVLRLQRVIEMAVEQHQLTALSPITIGDGLRGYGAIVRDAFAVTFKANQQRSQRGSVEILHVLALTPATRGVSITATRPITAKFEDSATGAPEITPNEGTRMLEIFTADPITYIDGPWWALLDKDILAMRADIDVAMAPDHEAARRTREEREQHEQTFRDQFVQEHGV